MFITGLLKFQLDIVFRLMNKQQKRYLETGSAFLITKIDFP